MLVYGDQSRIENPRDAFERLDEMLRGLGRLPAGIERHAVLVAALIDAGELAQGLADAQFEDLGHDARSGLTDALMALLIGIDRFVASFDAAPYAIILTYWLGQWGITASAFQRSNSA